MNNALIAFVVIGLALGLLVSEGIVSINELETAGSWIWNRLKELKN